MTDKASVYALANTRDLADAIERAWIDGEPAGRRPHADLAAHAALAFLRGLKPKVEAHNRQARADALSSTQLEVDVLKAALIEIRDRCGRVAEARAVARRVLGDG